MLKRNLAILAVAILALATISPELVMAKRGSDDSGLDDRGGRSRSSDDSDDSDDHFSDDKSFGVDFSNRRRNGDRKVEDSLAPRGVVKGAIISKTSTGFNVDARRSTTLTVDTSTATIVKLPNTTIALADLSVSDYVSVIGTRTGNNIVATKVFTIPMNLRKAEVKGSVTAVNGNQISLLTKKGKSVTVTTDASTKITGDHNDPALLSDIVVGSKLNMKGIWDSVSNTFSALKIRIK